MGGEYRGQRTDGGRRESDNVRVRNTCKWSMERINNRQERGEMATGGEYTQTCWSTERDGRREGARDNITVQSAALSILQTDEPWWCVCVCVCKPLRDGSTHIYASAPADFCPA